MKLLAEALDNRQIDCHATFEPTSSPIGTMVRSILRKELVTTPLALAMLFAADRENHLNNPVTGIVQRTLKGTLVLCDRYMHSSLAYQSIECGYDKVASLNEFPLPQVLFYIDTPVSDCLHRIDDRDQGGGRELFEHKEFLEKVRDNYEVIFAHLPPDVRFVRLDGTADRQTIHTKVCAAMEHCALL
jgi:dTMP kinase